MLYVYLWLGVYNTYMTLIYKFLLFLYPERNLHKYGNLPSLKPKIASRNILSRHNFFLQPNIFLEIRRDVSLMFIRPL